MEINVSYTYISKRWIKTSKVIIFQPTDSIQFRMADGWRLSQKHRAPGGNNPRQDTLLFQAHSHSHPHLLRLGQFKYTSSPNCTSLGCGRKLESPEKTYTDRGRMCQLHTDSDPARNRLFFSTLWWHDVEWNGVIWGPAMHFKYLTILFVDYIQYIWKRKRKKKVWECRYDFI